VLVIVYGNLLGELNMAFCSVLAASLIMKFVAVIWFLIAVILVFVVLIQKGKGGGLSGVFGGGMAGSLLGADTKKPMTWFTIGLVSVFLLLAVLMAKFYKPSASSVVDETPVQQSTVPDIVGDMDNVIPDDIIDESVDVNSI
jgi:preprotein translocase subunit SecG